MIEICKNIAINIFWVLAALFQVGLLAALLTGILSRLLEKISKKDGKE